jgi:outer membrane biosynthesis protein TonB
MTMASRPLLQIVPPATALETGRAVSIANEGESSHRPWFWVIVLALSLLVHLALSLFKIGGGETARRYEIQTVDPAKLEAVRKSWREQKLLMSRDPSKPDDTPAPADARYMSDRNRRVEREQRARLRDTSPLARPGVPNAQTQKPQTAQKTPRANPARSVPKLSDLGTPFRFSDVTAKPSQARTPSDQARQAQAAQTEGGQQYLQDSAPEGDQNILNTQESVYYSFYARLYDQIGPIWQSNVRSVMGRQRLQPGEYITQVDVVLLRDGTLKEVRILQSSRVRELDQIVPESWARVGNFPNPPKDLVNPQGEVHTGWTFHVHVSEGFGFQVAPPQRTY